MEKKIQDEEDGRQYKCLLKSQMFKVHATPRCPVINSLIDRHSFQRSRLFP